VLKGRLRVEYGDTQEVIQAGDTSYLPGGHTAFTEEDIECLECSPADQYQRVMKLIVHNACMA